MGIGRRIIIPAVSAIVALSVPESYGQSGFEEWWRTIAECGGTGPNIDGVALRYTIEDVYVPDAAMLAAMRARVANHPDHPERQQLALYDARARGARHGRANVLWRFGNRWRWNLDNLSEPGGYGDMAWGDGIAWHLTPEYLGVVDQAGASAETIPIQNGSSSTSADVCMILTANIASVRAAGLSLSPVRSSDRWTVAAIGTIRDGMPARFKAEGRWFEDEGWGTIDSSELVAGMPGETPGVMAVEVDGWRFDDRLGIGLPATLLERDASRRVQRRVTVGDTEEFSRRDFDRLVQLPDRVMGDPVRGRAGFTRFVDMRRGERRVAHVDETTRKLTDVRAGEDTREYPGLRRWGWAILAGAVATIAFLWLRRSARG